MTSFLWEGAVARLPRLAGAALLSLLCIASGAALLAVSGFLVQQAATRPPILSLTLATVGVRLFSLLRASARYIERLATHDTVLRMLEDARVAVFAAIEPRSPAAFDRDRSGDLMRRISADVDALQDFYARGLLPPLVSLLVAVIAVAVASVFAAQLGLALGVALVACAAVIVLTAALTARGSAQRLAALSGELAAELTETLQGCADLIGAGAMERRLRRIEAFDAQITRESRRLGWSRAAATALVSFATGTTVLAALVGAIAAVDAGVVPAIAVGIAALGAMAISEPFASLPAAVDAVRGGAEAARRLLDVMSRPLPITPAAEPVPLPEAVDVDVRDVTMRYGTEAGPVLDHVSLRLRRGRRVGIVGPSGSGKSTLASVLVRFHDVEEGCVTLGGVDVRELREADVRLRIGLLAQDAHIFATTIRENVRLARPGASDEELREAARRAHLLPWIESRPQGWDTRVGEHGAHMSGGQRRRLALARALLADFPVLIVDEPTEALDERTAAAVMDDILSATRDRALLVISHRARDMEQMDEVLTMRHGRLTTA